MEENKPDSRVEKMVSELTDGYNATVREQAIIKSLKAEQLFFFKKIASIITIQTTLLVIVMVLIVFYFRRPSPANVRLLNEIREERRVLRSERELLARDKEIFYGLRDSSGKRINHKK